ncbi:hypothetical protein [Hansschlegelia sp.]|uniref:hypothetical protein n=1 Tax=Hansschlegelia sp. TaxID=2041892 RepID=UPI002B9E9675|nr:hypothetical protein [Hansschlegelia sp.]HVI29712.1 hypothetical protein [Hansschlegelia sp.]
MARDAAERPVTSGTQSPVAALARLALAHERAGRYRDAWTAWEQLRSSHPDRSDWNAPLAASYLRFALEWTADAEEGSLREAEEALVRGVAILTVDLSAQSDDVARLMLVARACEQRCILRAFGEGWTREVREALEAGAPVNATGDRRQVSAAGAAATVALDLVAISAPSLAPLAPELAQSCLRLAATLQAVGSQAQAKELLLRAETVLRGPQQKPARPKLVAIEGDVQESGRTPPRRPALSIVTSRTA